jgi:hypothetical protein
MAKDTFQLTRVESEDLSHDNTSHEKVYSKTFSSKIASVSFTSLPKILHSRTVTDDQRRLTHNMSTSSFSSGGLEPIRAGNSRAFSRLDTSKVSESLITDIKHNISQTFDYQIAHCPKRLSESMSKLASKETTKNHHKGFKAKMLELRRKKDSLEKERIYKEEKLASLLGLTHEMAILGTQHDLSDRADEIEAKIAAVSQDYLAERFTTQVLESMAKQRATSQKFCLIRNDKAKESLNKLKHQIKESEKLLLHDQLVTRSLKIQVHQLLSENLRMKKARKAEIQTKIASYREDLEVEHHIHKHKESLVILEQIRKNKTRLKLLMDVERSLRAEDRMNVNLSLQDSYLESFHIMCSKLQQATKAENADSIVAMYNAIQYSTEELQERRAFTETELKKKRKALKGLLKERDLALTSIADFRRQPKCVSEDEIESRTLELSLKEGDLEIKRLREAQVISALSQLCISACEAYTKGSSGRVVGETDFASLASHLVGVLTPMLIACPELGVCGP